MSQKNKLSIDIQFKDQPYSHLVSYHINDLTQLTQEFQKLGIPCFIINKQQFPSVFKNTKYKICIQASISLIQEKLLELKYPLVSKNSEDEYIEILGKNRDSFITIYSLYNVTPFDVKEEIEYAMTNGYAHNLLLSWKETGMLSSVFPELTDCYHVDGGEHHKETVFEHLIECLMHARNYPVRLQWAVLLHDIGKPATIKTSKDQSTGKITTTFYKHEVVGEKLTNDICKRFSISSSDTEYIMKMVLNHMFRFEDESSDKSIRRWLYRLGKEDWSDIFKLRECDRKGNRAKKGKSIIPEKTKILLERIDNIIKTSKVVFREDLNISDKEILQVINIEDLEIAISNLVGMINSNALINEKDKIVLFLKR